MTLPPELTSRLQALKALLDLGDVELASSAASRLQAHREISSIAQITDYFSAHRYTEAGRLITTVLSEGTRLVRWTDPEIMLLEAELERLSSDLAEAEAEQAELAHQIARFHAAHHQTLGARLEKLLRLRIVLREREAAADPAKTADYAQAQQDYDSFQQDSAFREDEDARTKWELSEDEQQELKRLFRKASKKCHPDVVPPDHQAAAAAMFRDLSEAYEKGDLVRVQQIASQAEAGIFTTSDKATAEDQKASLQARVQAVRAALEKARADLAAVQQSAACRVMSQQPDWDAYFQSQATKLDQEIKRLADAIEGSKP
ncbi:MAG: J domain-containing protein [Prosthecobacter sp.]|nr:J domain-containing protein [Prosthecobacter sp.]